MRMTYKQIRFWLIIFLLVFISTKILSGRIYQQMTKNLDAGINEVKKIYQEKVEKFSGNPSDLVLDGISLIKRNEMDLAFFPLKKATETEQNYRDGFLYLGYYYFKIGETNEAIVNLEKAAELDPIYPFTYKLLSEGYRKIKDEGKFLAAKNKYEMLIK